MHFFSHLLHTSLTMPSLKIKYASIHVTCIVCLSLSKWSRWPYWLDYLDVFVDGFSRITDTHMTYVEYYILLPTLYIYIIFLDTSHSLFLLYVHIYIYSSELQFKTHQQSLQSKVSLHLSLVACRLMGKMAEENGSEDYTRDGTVDLKGRPVLRSKTGRWKACYFIVGMYICMYMFILYVLSYCV